MIIEVVGKEIEKIKGDFESYLNGLNMVGEISYSQYSKLYDEGTKQIQRAYELGKSELEKENAELKELLEACKQERIEALYRNEQYIKENAELKKQQFSLRNERNTFLAQNEQYERDLADFNENLIKAKDLLKQWLQTSKASGCDNINIVTDTEQFLSEVEK